jgi:hypothetical protein
MVGCPHILFAYLHNPHIQLQFDTNGATGGCQAIYTVYPSETTSCGNLSVPTQVLDVEGLVDDGPISQYGWIDQVRDQDPEPTHSQLMCIPVHGRLPHPQERDAAVHHAYRPCSPPPVQDHVL